MISTWIALRKAGLLGINERNLRLVNDLNPRRLMRLVNDKTETKRLAIEADIPTPELYGLIRNPLDMRNLEKLLGRYQAGDKVEIVGFRRDELMTFSLTLAAGGEDTAYLQIEDESQLKGWLS